MKNQGFIALISTILISAVLLLVSLEESTAGFIHRFNILTDEEKLESFYLAKSCLEFALVHPNATGTITMGNNNCQIISLEKISTDQYSVKTRAAINNAITNLSALIIISSNVSKLTAVKEI